MKTLSHFILPLLLGVLIMVSCCGIHTEIEYSYNDVVITRIDECGQSTFYLGTPTNNKGCVRSEYSGINDGFHAYLVFKDHEKIEILVGDGVFEFCNGDVDLFTLRHILSHQAPQVEGGVYEILLSNQYEKIRNDNTNTRVKARYEIDENEWW